MMTIDPAIMFVLIVAAAGVGAIVVWVFVRGRIPPDVALLIAQCVAEAREYLGDTFTTADVKAFAGWMYDQWIQGSDYYTRDEFIDLILRALARGRHSKVAVRAAIENDNQAGR